MNSLLAGERRTCVAARFIALGEVLSYTQGAINRAATPHQIACLSTNIHTPVDAWTSTRKGAMLERPLLRTELEARKL